MVAPDPEIPEAVPAIIERVTIQQAAPVKQIVKPSFLENIAIKFFRPKEALVEDTRIKIIPSTIVYINNPLN